MDGLSRNRRPTGGKMIKISRRLCAALAFSVLLASPLMASAAERTVVVVMFDGFAPAMIDATTTPNFDRMKREGVWSRHLVPAFPTLSMANHATFLTGCWPEHHGIISNIFYDPRIVQMHGIFYAWGSGIAKGREIPRLDMIDIHPTVMALLGLQPGRPMDGHVLRAALAQ